MNRQALVSLALVVLLVLCSACTSRDRYTNIREEQRQQCELAVSEALRERCLAELPPASYDEYERLRRTLPEPREDFRQ